MNNRMIKLITTLAVAAMPMAFAGPSAIEKLSEHKTVQDQELTRVRQELATLEAEKAAVCEHQQPVLDSIRTIEAAVNSEPQLKLRAILEPKLSKAELSLLILAREIITRKLGKMRNQLADMRKEDLKATNAIDAKISAKMIERDTLTRISNAVQAVIQEEQDELEQVELSAGLTALQEGSQATLSSETVQNVIQPPPQEIKGTIIKSSAAGNNLPNRKVARKVKGAKPE